MNNLPALRNVLYDILTGSSDQEVDGDTVIQNMGLNLSNAVKKDGVNIIALQSANIHKITVKVTEGLRLIDEMQQPQVIDVEPEPEPETVEGFMRAKIEQGYDLRQFLDMISSLYVVTAVDMLGQDQAKRRLRIRGETLSKALRPTYGGNEIATDS